MAAGEQSETIDLSEAIRTILGESDSPGRGISPARKGATQRNGSSDLNNSSHSGKNMTPVRSKSERERGVKTPLSRKSSILQRSLGSDYSQSASPKKRRHAHDVIILRPPKKRSVGSTPRVTSTSKIITPGSSSTGTNAKVYRQNNIDTTPVSRPSKPRILRRASISSKEKTVKPNSEGEHRQGNVSTTSDLSLSPSKLFSLDGIESLSDKEKEDLALKAQYLRLLQQQQEDGQGDLTDTRAIMEALLKGGCKGLKVGQGGLSLDVAGQTSKISLVARGNQDDSLTNITWLRRMSAPDLDPGTLKQIQDPHKDRPPYSYSALIQFAISSAPEGKLTLRDIYFWIETHFPYFRSAKLGWKNSIRHNLSLHKIFVREAPSGPGQPAFWTLRPGTVVRMPERKVFVHEEAGAHFQAHAGIPPECFAAPNQEGGINLQGIIGGSQIPVNVNPLASPNMMLGGSSGLPPLLPGQEGLGMGGAPVLTSTPVIPRPSSRGSKRVPPILPKGTPPYALVPLPIYFTSDPRTGQLVPTNSGDAPLAPLDTTDSPVAPIAGPPPPPAEKSSRKQKIAPKATLTTPTRRPKVVVERLESAGRNIMDSGYGSTDSSVGEENALPSLSGIRPTDIRTENEKNDCPGGKENVFSAEFDLGLDVDDDLLKTPPKNVCPDWLSPIRGFTPLRDSGLSLLKDMDFNFTPLKTGLTPNSRMGSSITPRHQMLSPLQRNIPLGVAGGRSGRKARLMTPRRFPQEGDGAYDSLHNSSFEQMFGDVEFDVDPDNIDVGNMSWLLQTPPPAK